MRERHLSTSGVQKTTSVTNVRDLRQNSVRQEATDGAYRVDRVPQTVWCGQSVDLSVRGPEQGGMAGAGVLFQDVGPRDCPAALRAKAW